MLASSTGPPRAAVTEMSVRRSSVGGMTARIALGIVARTGWAVAVALGGSADKPVFAGRWPIELVPDDLPSFQPYLRSKYRGMPTEAVDDLERAFERIVKKHGYRPEGPRDGEDEAP